MMDGAGTSGSMHAGMTSPISLHDPFNSHFIVDPESASTHSGGENEDDQHAVEADEAAEHEENDDDELHIDVERELSDGDTASQHSVSLHSPSSFSHSRTTSIDLNEDTPAHHQPLSLAPATPANTYEPEPALTPVTLIRRDLSTRMDSTNKRDSHPYTLDTELSSDQEQDDRSSFMRRLGESPVSSVATSLYDETVEDHEEIGKGKIGEDVSTTEQQDVIVPAPSFGSSMPSSARTVGQTPTTPSYPPPPLQKPQRPSSVSTTHSNTSYSKKARPESMLVSHTGPLVLGIALVDFNHLVGPKIEFSRGAVFDADEEMAKILPFLALPDGAHLTIEDYSYFHLVPNTPNNAHTPSTVFGISCNRQIRTSDLLVKDQDVTRSTVQKAVVVLASKPVFGPIRDRLGVVTRALFAQRDFTDMTILEEFQQSLELSLKSQLTESGLYMGTSLRELVHTFRQRTLVLLKALMLQKKIMFYGHPVEKLCTYQYSLVTLVPGLLQHLDDCGSPPLATRAGTLSRPTELKTSDPKSMMAYVGLPLDLFGKDAFFQPYLPLQQLDMLKDTQSWLCGSTNSIVTQQKEVDLLVNVETGAIEFRDQKLERSAGLTAADRKWMDDVVKDVNDGWDETDPALTPKIQFKGSDDYLRQKFDEYISGALASVKYSDFMAKGQGNGVVIADGSGNPDAIQDFNMLWISEFKKTNAYEVWERVTDPLLFDIMEPRHPCSERPSVVSDIGLRLTEGIQELKLDQQLDSTREALSRTFAAGSTGFFKAVEGVRGRWMQRTNSTPQSTVSQPSAPGSPTCGVMEATKSDTASVRSGKTAMTMSPSFTATPEPSPRPPSTAPRGMRPLSLVVQASPQPPPTQPETKSAISSWGSGLGSFFSQRASRLSVARPAPSSTSTHTPTPPREASPAPSGASSRPQSRAGSFVAPADLGVDELRPRNLDELYIAPSQTPPSVSAAPRVPQATDLNSSTSTVHGGAYESSRHSLHGSIAEEDEHDDHEPAGTGFAL